MSSEITIEEISQPEPIPNINVKKNSEDQFGKVVDRCLTDTLIKGGGGLFVGAVFSLLFFKRRSWPIMLGTGFGFGTAYRNCEIDLNSK